MFEKPFSQTYFSIKPGLCPKKLKISHAVENFFTTEVLEKLKKIYFIFIFFLQVNEGMCPGKYCWNGTNFETFWYLIPILAVHDWNIKLIRTGNQSFFK